jgi:GT2 family glycosyltransferase
MTRRLVSVVVPAYNRAYCLGRTLDSVLRQTHQNLEVILIDDGSTDNTRELICSHAASDSRIKYVYQENQGVAAARNMGMRQSQGDYVAFLDSDDTWEPWKLELQLACLEHCPEVGMVWTDMVAVGPDGAVVDPRYLRTMYNAYRWFTSEQLYSQSYPLAGMAPNLSNVVGAATFSTGTIFSQMVMGNLVHTSTVLLRRERLQSVGPFNEDLRIAEDYEYFLRTCKQGLVGFVDLATIQYQTGMPDRLTRDSYKLPGSRNCLRIVLQTLERDRGRICLPPAMIRSRLAELHDWIGDCALKMGQTADARRHLLQSLGYSPLQLRTLCLLGVSGLPFGVGLSAQSLFRSVKRQIRRIQNMARPRS